MNKCIVSLILVLFYFTASAQNPQVVTYKTIDTTSLDLIIYNPDDFNAKDKHPAILFFFGGGWSSGSTNQFKYHAMDLAEQGMVAILVEYRTAKSHKVDPTECVKDAKAAMRYVRENAKKLGVNPKKIAAGGGSAGGHLAAATALCSGFNHADDNFKIDCRPNTLVLFNPVIDNSEQGYGYSRIEQHFPAFSPMHNITSKAPPTIFMLGTKDKHIPVSTAEKYAQLMHDAGSRCEVYLYEDQEHGFFNNWGKPNPYYDQTMAVTKEFLRSLKYIKE